jgi:hypothetical protein
MYTSNEGDWRVFLAEIGKREDAFGSMDDFFTAIGDW